VCVSQFVVGLDPRALLAALPTLTHTFHAGLTTIQWVLLIYYDLTLIGWVITVGRLGDWFSRRRFYTSGFLLFVLSSPALRRVPIG
jgi:MFS family permease